MNVTILGAEGMLGSRAFDVFHARGDSVSPYYHDDCDVTNRGALLAAMHESRPHLVINCAGVRDESDRANMVRVNAFAPHLIASCLPLACRMIHISTDCVFDSPPSAAPRMATRSTPPSPGSLYARSKLAGEIDYLPNVLTVRTSFVGPEHGLWAWYADADDPVKGWTEAWWSGSTVAAVAAALPDLLLLMQPDQGYRVVQLATERPITKHDLLRDLRLEFNHGPTILPQPGKGHDRSMAATLSLPPFREALRAMIEQEGLR